MVMTYCVKWPQVRVVEVPVRDLPTNSSSATFLTTPKSTPCRSCFPKPTMSTCPRIGRQERREGEPLGFARTWFLSCDMHMISKGLLENYIATCRRLHPLPAKSRWMDESRLHSQEPSLPSLVTICCLSARPPFPFLTRLCSCDTP